MSTTKVTIELGREEHGTSEHVHACATSIRKCVDAKDLPFYRLIMVEGDVLICQWDATERVFRLD